MRLFFKNSFLFLIVLGSFIGIVAVMMLLSNTPPAATSLWRDLEIREAQPVASEKRSNYQSIREQGRKEHTLRYKGEKSNRNSLLDLYKEEEKQPKREQAPVKAAKKQEEAFFTAYNSDVEEQPCFFEAVFRARQQVQDGKPLRIFLKEAIAPLQLAAGTILKGTPYIEGNRIKIRITAAVYDHIVRRVELLCLEKEDCTEGLYHDALAEQLAEDTQEGFLEEVLELGFEGGDVVRKGGRVAKRFSDLAKRNKTIFIESGREVLIMLPEQE